MEKFQNMWKLNDINIGSKKSKGKSENTLKPKKCIQKCIGYSKSNTKSKAYSSKCLHLKRIKSSNKQLNIIPSGTRKTLSSKLTEGRK